MACERINLPVVNGQDLRGDGEGPLEHQVLSMWEEYSNGCYISLSRDNYKFDGGRKFTELVDAIGVACEDPDWTEVLIDWSW